MTPPRRDRAEQARVDAALVDIFEQHIVFNQLLGLKIASVRPGDVRGTVAMRPELVGHAAYGRLHGGVISSVLDAMGALALMVAQAERHPHETVDQVTHRYVKLATIDLRVDFLRQGQGLHFIATAEVSRLGGRVGSTQMRLHNDEGTLVSTAAAAYMVG
jgi:uncharacterized protein (TIGR00369 family)